MIFYESAMARRMTYQQIFSEGYAACKAGKSNIDNPYTDDGDCEAWNDGWLDRLDAENEAAETCMDYDL